MSNYGPLGSLHADRAEIRRLRALTEGDPSSIYWEAAQYREALRDIAEHPGYGALSMRQRAQDALRRVQESAVAASEPEAP